MSCTSALGLGQNWTHARIVVQLSRAGLSEVTQVVGRVGRNTRPGIAVIYLEENQKEGLNSIDDFKDMTSQTDDQRMDALKVSKVCVRIALVLANTTGFIPMYPDHYSVQKEAQRQRDQGFPPCRCEICEPEECEILVRNLHLFTSSNFEEGLKNPRSLDPNADYSPAGMKAAAKIGTTVTKRKRVN